MKRLTNIEIDKRLKSRSVKRIGNYVNMKTKLEFECKKCGHEFCSNAGAIIINEQGCPKCAGQLRTTQDVIDDIKNKPFDFIDNYRGSTIKYKFKCNCGNVFTDTYNNAIIRKTGCGKCKNVSIEDNERLFSKSTKKSYNKFVQIMNNNNYSIVGEYINSRTKIEIKCEKHDFILQRTPNDIMQGYGKCPQCKKEIADNKRIERQEKLFMKKINNDNLINIVGEFKGLDKSSKFKCLTCDNEWNTMPRYYYFFNSRCPKCKASKGESAIINYLENNNVKYEHEFTFEDFIGKRNRHYRFDFAILGKRNGVKALIEYDGIMHYKKKRKSQDLLDSMERDNIKSEYAKNKKIKLIRIPYWDFDNIEKILKKELKGVV